MRTPLALRSLFGLALVVVVFALIPPMSLPSTLDLRTIAVHTVLVALVGMGLTLVIATGAIDLSVGSSVALCGVVAAITSRNGASLPVVLIAGIGTGAACGLYNALLVSAFRLPSFIVTLGTLGFFRGLSKWASGSRTVSADTRGLEYLMQPTPSHSAWLVAPGVWIMAALAACLSLLLSRSVLGTHLLAVGGNQTAARMAGVPVARTRAWAFLLCGVLAGVAACLQFGRLTLGDPTVNAGLELEAVAAAVIGGASLSGGTGSIAGTVVGAFLMAYLRNRCAALGWPNFVQDMIVGHIIIAAVGLDAFRRR